MCGVIEVMAYDALMVIGMILIVIWILSITNVIHVSSHGLQHMFIALAVVFVIAWLFTRCFCRTRQRRRQSMVA